MKIPQLPHSLRITVYFLAYILVSQANLAGVEAEFNISSLNLYQTATNRNFKLMLHGEPLFFRMGRDNPEQVGIDRAAEIEHYKIAEALGLAPRLLAYQIDNGILVAEFIEGSSPSEVRIHETELLEKITQNLKLLHACHCMDSTESSKNVFSQCDALLAEFSTINDHAENLERWSQVRYAFENGYYDGIKEGLCHGDLFRGNLLEAEEGTLYMVDWEYSYYGPVIDDLGKLCSANWLTEEEICTVAELYWDDAGTELVHKLKQNIFMQQMKLYLWCQVQAHHDPKASQQYLSLAARAEEHLDQLVPELGSK